jgi:hypothetical protein
MFPPGIPCLATAVRSLLELARRRAVVGVLFLCWLGLRCLPQAGSLSLLVVLLCLRTVEEVFSSAVVVLRAKVQVARFESPVEAASAQGPEALQLRLPRWTLLVSLDL